MPPAGNPSFSSYWRGGRRIPLHQRTAADYADRYGEYESLYAALIDMADELTDFVGLASQRVLTTTALWRWRDDIEAIGDREATIVSMVSIENRRQRGDRSGRSGHDTPSDLVHKTAVRDALLDDVATVFSPLADIRADLTTAAGRVWLSPLRRRAVFAAALAADGTLKRRMYHIEHTLGAVTMRALEEL